MQAAWNSLIDPAEADEVYELLRLCNESEGLDIKVSIPGLSGSGAVRCLAQRDRGQLVAYCSVDGLSSVEISGMVRPGSRRQGRGRALLEAAVAEARQSGATRVLLICEQAAAGAQALAAAEGWTIAQREHRMVADNSEPPPALGGTRLERVDRPEVLGPLVADALDVPEEETRGYLERSGQAAGEATFAFWHGSDRVGTFRLVRDRGRALVYGFGIIGARRGEGLGGLMLDLALAEAHDWGLTTVALEVDPENQPAVRLYESRGFRVTGTYDYYAPPVSLDARGSRR